MYTLLIFDPEGHMKKCIRTLTKQEADSVINKWMEKNQETQIVIMKAVQTWIIKGYEQLEMFKIRR